MTDSWKFTLSNELRGLEHEKQEEIIKLVDSFMFSARYEYEKNEMQAHKEIIMDDFMNIIISKIGNAGILKYEELENMVNDYKFN